MSRFRLTLKAQEDLREIRAYIAERGSNRAAARWIGTLRQRFRRLAETPGMGRPRDDLAPDLRSLAVGDYLIFYRQERGGIQIVHVLHGARDIEQLFQQEQPE
jgi:toxin ParE1/3/4